MCQSYLQNCTLKLHMWNDTSETCELHCISNAEVLIINNNKSIIHSGSYSGFRFRLISWGGNKIDPVGVDFILQKLGFQHARLTIPKWIQRGFMDPLDGILSVLVKQLIKSLKEEQNQSIDGRAESDIM